MNDLIKTEVGPSERANQKPGNQLCLLDQKIARMLFVHRFTGENKPAWAQRPWKDGLPYPLQFADDADWLANTLFFVKLDGRINQSATSCYSSPTWPNNPELRTK